MQYFPIFLIPESIGRCLYAFPIDSDSDEPQRPVKSSIFIYSILSITFIAVLYYLIHFLSFVLIPVFVILLIMIEKSNRKHFKEEYQKYLENLKLFTEKNSIGSFIQEIELSEYRMTLILEALSKAKLPKFQDISDKYRKGKSEEYFYGYLEKYFGEKIYQNMEFEIPNAKKNLSPDFLFWDKNINFVIDIEIDEPYVSDGKKSPIHTTESDHDQRRNSMCIDAGWTVIRFAEEQIIKYPNECCKFIAEQIYYLINDYSYLHYFSDVEDVQLLKRWSEKEAKEMANNNYRETYLINGLEA